MPHPTTDQNRSEPKRFTSDDVPLRAADLIPGDRVDPSLVSSTMDGLGERWSADPDAAPTQLAEATITNRMNDVHRAILVDGETGALLRAGRHDSQAAWSQREADWKIREVGDRVAVEAADVDQDGNDEWTGADPATAAEQWANVVLQDRARGAGDYDDELTLESGSSLTLREPYGPTKVYATIALEGGR